MKLIPTKLTGVFLVEIEPVADHRGFFARLWCEEAFEKAGLVSRFVQTSGCYNKVKGTVRGLHFQRPPSQEAKLVRCEQGKVFDVIVDLRPDSPSFSQHISVILDSQKWNAIYVPSGFAHGYQTLEDHCVMNYMMSDVFRPELADGVRYNDPAFGIDWPLPANNMLERDKHYPNFDATAWLGQL